VRAIREPVPIDEDTLATFAGDYGPRHLRLRGGRLFYSRDGVAESAQRPLFAESPDTFVLEGVTSFKLRVARGPNGLPTKLEGLYEGGRQDFSPRDAIGR
jgi:hypothetical protein